jgi:hypothetical protein
VKAGEADPDTIFLMLPYHEDQVTIIQKLAQIPDQIGPQVVVFGHLGLNGAVQNTNYNTKFVGSMGPDLFKKFRRTYTGHFHVHQRMDPFE